MTAYEITRPIIEFVGPPGAGKSSICRELGALETLRVVNLDGYRTLDGSPQTPSQHRAERLASFFFRPTLSCRLAGALLKESGGLSSSFLVNLARRNRDMVQLSRSHAGAAVEEGALHAMVLILCARRYAWNWHAIARRLQPPDLVVRVECPPNVVHERVVGRGGVLSDRSEEYLVGLAENYNEYCAHVLRLLGVPVVTVDSSTISPRMNAADIARRIVDISR